MRIELKDEEGWGSCVLFYFTCLFLSLSHACSLSLRHTHTQSYFNVHCTVLVFHISLDPLKATIPGLV